jgi:signal transduction histidine kinase
VASERDTRRLAEEQSALRGIATQVAAEVPPRTLLAQVTVEVGRLLNAPSARVVRYEEDGRAAIVGGWAEDGDGLPVGSSVPADGETVLARVRRGGDACEMLAASRARIVEAGDAEHRRLERSLHDGDQQRLVALVVQSRLIQAAIDSDLDGARHALDGATTELREALEELRELARGLHPAVLTNYGLGRAVAALAARSPVPVEITAMPEERLPAPVEGDRRPRRGARRPVADHEPDRGRHHGAR